MVEAAEDQAIDEPVRLWRMLPPLLALVVALVWAPLACRVGDAERVWCLRVDILLTVACLMIPCCPDAAVAVAVEQDAADDPRGGTIGGGDEEEDDDEQVDGGKSTVAAIVVVVADFLQLAPPPVESLRRNSLADARLKSARLTRPLWPLWWAPEDEWWPPFLEPFAHFSIATGPPATTTKRKEKKRKHFKIN